MELLFLGLLFGLIAMPFAVVLLWLRVARLERDLQKLERGRAARRGAEPLEPSTGEALESPVSEPVVWQPPRPLFAPPRRVEPVQGAPGQGSAAQGTAAQSSPAQGSPAERAPGGSTESRPDPRVEPQPRPAASPEVRPEEAARGASEWERWLGVRGAGLLGGVVAALAALLLFRHAVQEGWVTPALRVSAGLIGGLVSAGAGLWLYPRGYRVAPEALIGAGAAAWYAALWASSQLYGFWPAPLSFALMALVTAVLCALAMRHASAVIAGVGLLGGFATPLLVGGPEDRPLGLFGYLLLLNLGLLLVAGRLRVAWMGLAAVLATAVLQALWLTTHHRPGRETFALLMLAVFAGLFALWPRTDGAKRSNAAGASAALLLPFLLALHVAQRGGAELVLGPIAMFAAALLAGALVLGRREGLAHLPLAASAGALALVGAWLLPRTPTAGDAFGLVLTLAVLGALPLLVERFGARFAAREAGEPVPVGAASVNLGAAAAVLHLGGAGLLLLLGLAPGSTPPAVAPLGWALLGALALAQATRSGLRPWPVPGLLGLTAGFALVRQIGIQVGERALFGPWAPTAVLLLLALLWHVGAAWFGRGRPGVRRAGLWAAGLYPLPLLALWAHSNPLHASGPWAALLPVALLALAALAAAAASAEPRRADATQPQWLFGLTAVAGLAALAGHANLWGLCPFARFYGAEPTALGSAWAAALMATGLLLLLAFVLAARLRGLVRAPWVPWSAALFGLGAFVFLRRASQELEYGGAEALFAGAMALMAGFGAFAPRLLGPSFAHPTRTLRAALGGAAVLLGAWALARAYDGEPRLVAAGLAAAGFAVLWVRSSHPAVPYAGLAAALTASLLAFVRFLQVEPYAGGGLPLLNTMAVAHGTAALGCVALTLAFARSAPRGPLHASASAGLSAAGIVFLWLTLTVIELWSAGGPVRWPDPRPGAFDLTLSLSWAAYGLGLLGIGLWRGLAGPRWLSLAVLLLVIAKVFLFDLAHLEGLARVGSLAGLALSLIAVSLLYQRYVFTSSRIPVEGTVPGANSTPPVPR